MANMIKYSERRYFGFFHPILTWEYHCFGYRKGGHTQEEVFDGYEHTFSETSDTITVTSREKSHTVRTAFFRRHEEYPKNPLFVILELLMNLVSRIRITFAKFFIIAYILLCYLLEDFDLVYIGESAGKIALAIYACSFIIPLTGFIVRRAFGLDQRIDDICDENGWKRWSEYEDK